MQWRKIKEQKIKGESDLQGGVGLVLFRFFEYRFRVYVEDWFALGGLGQVGFGDKGRNLVTRVGIGVYRVIVYLEVEVCVFVGVRWCFVLFRFCLVVVLVSSWGIWFQGDRYGCSNGGGVEGVGKRVGVVRLGDF